MISLSDPRLLTPHSLAVVLAALGSAATVFTAATPFLQPDKLKKRIRSVTTERERIRAREREREA